MSDAFAARNCRAHRRRQRRAAGRRVAGPAIILLVLSPMAAQSMRVQTAAAKLGGQDLKAEIRCSPQHPGRAGRRLVRPASLTAVFVQATLS